jgi:hypothetical protein
VLEKAENWKAILRTLVWYRRIENDSKYGTSCSTKDEQKNMYRGKICRERPREIVYIWLRYFKPNHENRCKHHPGHLVEKYVNTYLKLPKIKMIPHISCLSNGIALE